MVCGYDGYLTQVFILSRAGVTWIPYSGYISPLCWINNCHTPKGYAVTLKIWVLSGLVCFGEGLVVFGIIYIYIYIYKDRALHCEFWETSTDGHI